ncbi:MAG: tetratricopeptide repeat protein [Planctomycetota bacterium]|nr:MAG: tetratricopeptide repeat protein [Planctomycetota bacterium]
MQIPPSLDLKSLLRPLQALFLAGAAGSPLSAGDDQSELSPSRTVIVVSDNAEAFAGNESVGRISPGSVLTYSQENGPWLMVPRRGGWVNREHVVAIERAGAYFDELLIKKPAPQVYHHRGITRLTTGDYEKAIADFDRAIREGLDDPGVYVNRGAAHQRSGDLEKAVEDYTQAITLNAENSRAYDNRANALAELGQFEESLADFEQALRITPDFPEAYNNRGVTHRMMGDFDKAISDYSKAIELFPYYSAAYANRGYARKRQGQFAEAIEDYSKAIELDDRAAGAMNDLAWLLATCSQEDLRDPGRAVELAQRACELTDSSNGDYLDTLAAAQAAAGDFDAAVETAEQALERAPEESKPSIASRLELFRSGEAFVEE